MHGNLFAGATIGTWTGGFLSDSGVWTNNSDAARKTDFEPIVPPRKELYPFRFRDPVTGRWRNARYKAERHVIAERHTDWEITGPPDVHLVDERAGYFSPWPRAIGDALPNVAGRLAVTRQAQPLRLAIAGVAC